MAKLQFATLSNLQEFLNLHNVQIDSKISEAVKSSIKTVSQSEDGYTLYFYTKTAPVTIDEAAFTITIPQPTGKADVRIWYMMKSMKNMFAMSIWMKMILHVFYRTSVNIVHIIITVMSTVWFENRCSVLLEIKKPILAL